VREERSAGFSIRDARGGLSADAALLGWGEGPDGRSVALSAYRRVGDVFLRANGRYWTREAVRSLALGPSVRFPAGPMEVDLAYQRYRTDRDGSALTSHTGDVDLTFRLGSDLRATLGAQQQWGSNFGGTRLHLGFWRSF
jgi:hypothetical protein